MERFEALSISPLEEYQAEGLYYRHKKTGCEIYHLKREDAENLFAFAFKTPAEDNSGAAHIMEHSVLSGSEKYPVKDPFLSLMSGSMHTFLNAMTYPDKTVYPAATVLEKDYFNLMSVYADAVFFPLLKKEIFLQEGCRIEYSEEGLPHYSGVVFNEMKGAYSNHDNVVAEYSYRSLFPDSPYRFDSGGEPESIPGLSYQDFIDFHKRYYHPSNCRIFLYGNIPTEKQLDFLADNYLDRFSAGQTPVEWGDQPDWDTPLSLTLSSPLAEESGPGPKSTITMNWKIAPCTDPAETLTLQILAEVLLGNLGAPLYKAVIDSGLGEDLCPSSGIEADLKEMVFTIGLRGTEEERTAAFESLVMDTLRDLVSQGIPADVLKGALYSVEFRNREIRGGSPFGLRLMNKALRGWLHGEHPEKTLGFTAVMETLKERYGKDSRYFEKSLKRWLLDNNHRSTVVVVPDPAHMERMENRNRQLLERYLEELTPEALRRLRAEGDALREYQQEPDSPESLDAVPTLQLSDVPPSIRTIPFDEGQLAGVPLYTHDLFTNGVVYIDYVLDVSGLEREELLLLPLFSRMICSSGLPGLSYDEVARQMSMKTGGLFTFLESSRIVGGGERDLLFFRLKTLESDCREGLQLAQGLLRQAQLADPRRIKDLVLEMRHDFKSTVIPMGNSLCALRAGAALHPVLQREELWRGVSQLLFIDDLADNIDSRAESLGQVLESLRARLLCRDRLLLNVTSPREDLPKVQQELQSFLTELPVTAPVPVSPEGSQGERREAAWEARPGLREALLAPASVGYSAVVFPAAAFGTPAHAYDVLLAHMLTTRYLWEEIRMKGGAYGVSASVNGTEGLFTFNSYRDPGLSRSLGIFPLALKYMGEGGITQEQLNKSIISTVGRDARPLSPGEASMIGLRRRLYHITDEMRREKREALLATTPGDIARRAAELDTAFREAAAAILADRKCVEELAVQVPEWLERAVKLPL